MKGLHFSVSRKLNDSSYSPPLIQENTYDEKIHANMLEIDEIEADGDGGLMLFNAHLSIVPPTLYFLKQSSSHLLLDGDEASNEWSKHLSDSVAKAFIDSGEVDHDRRRGVMGGCRKEPTFKMGTWNHRFCIHAGKHTQNKAEIRCTVLHTNGYSDCLLTASNGEKSHPKRN